MPCIRCDSADCTDPESKACSDNLAAKYKKERDEWKGIANSFYFSLIVAARDLKHIADLMPDRTAQYAQDCVVSGENKMRALGHPVAPPRGLSHGKRTPS